MEHKRPIAAWFRRAGALAVLALGAAVAVTSAAQIADSPQRVAFQISTGSTSGTYFPVGVLLGELLSHPPGVGRCEAANVCAPAGVILSARASEGSVSNVTAVNSGMVSSGLAQSDVVAMAVEGRGLFQSQGAAKDVRVIANLYSEGVHLVAAKAANITSVAGLRGKRVSLAANGSGTNITARSILAAYRMTERSVVASFHPTERAADLLQEGQIDAFFVVGGAPVSLIEPLLTEDVAVLVPIDGEGRDRLLMREPRLAPHVIRDGAYPGLPGVETVSVGALWITNASQPDDLVYGIVKALFNPAHRQTIQARQQGTNFVDLTYAATRAGAPLHPGAVRYFTEAGVLAPPAEAAPAATPPAAAAPSAPATAASPPATPAARP